MIQIGNDKIKEIYVGSIKIKEVYYGSEKVWGGVKGYWVHKDTGVITEFGLDDPNIFKGLLRNPSWRALASEVKIPYGVTGIADSCFAYCTALTSIILPESVTYIGNYCFYNCTSLPSITIPESVTYIGESCFEGCSSLTIATVFPTTPPTLGDIAFLGVHSSFNIKVPSDSVDDYKTAPGWSDYASIISGIDSYLVDKDNNNIYHFDLSNTPITNFENDSSIATVNGNQILKTYITEIHFGDSYTNVTSIGNYFLGSFENLVTIDLAVLSNITSIGDNFLYRTSITSIDLSPLSNVTSIGDNFLYSCYSLRSIDFTPLSNVTTIGNYFLTFCEELTTVDLFSLTNLTSIGTHFLMYCSKLTTLIMGAITPPTLGVSAFYITNLLSSIIVPCSSVYSYKKRWYIGQKIDLISDICEPEDGTLLPDGLYVLGRIDGVVGGADYTKRLVRLNYFTENIDEITYGGNSSAVISNGKLYTWGSNIWGQLGQGDNTNRTVPKQVGVDADWTKVSMGNSHTLAIRNGSLYGWGNNDYLQLTSNQLQQEYISPTKLGSYNDWVEVYAFENTSIGKRSNGLWYGWGYSGNGEIGYPNDGTNTFPPIKQLPHSTIFSGASKITFGKQHGLVINNGSLYGFGNGANYVFGNGDTQQYSSPTKLNDLTWTDIACGDKFSFGISNGELYFWGNPSYSVSGYGATETVTTPQKVDNNSDWTNIYVMKGDNYESTVIGIRNGDAYIWGAFYDYGEVMDSWDTIYINTPRLIETETNIINVVGSLTRMLILKQS